MKDTLFWLAIASSVLGSLVGLDAVHERDEARAQRDEARAIANDLDHAALLLGEPWSIMHGVASITRDLADGTANGWVGWLHGQDPFAPCVDGPGYVVCVALKETCLEKP